MLGKEKQALQFISRTLVTLGKIRKSIEVSIYLKEFARHKKRMT